MVSLLFCWMANFLLCLGHKTKRRFRREQKRKSRLWLGSEGYSSLSLPLLLVSLPVCRPSPFSTTCQAGMDDDLIGCETVPAQGCHVITGLLELFLRDGWSGLKHLFQRWHVMILCGTHGSFNTYKHPPLSSTENFDRLNWGGVLMWLVGCTRCGVFMELGKMGFVCGTALVQIFRSFATCDLVRNCEPRTCLFSGLLVHFMI